MLSVFLKMSNVDKGVLNYCNKKERLKRQNKNDKCAKFRKVTLGAPPQLEVSSITISGKDGSVVFLGFGFIKINSKK